MDSIKAAFADMGGATVVDFRRAVRPWRRQAARLIRVARRAGDTRRAVALRDAWRERLAVCEIEGGLCKPEAEPVALDALVALTLGGWWKPDDALSHETRKTLAHRHLT